MKSLLLVDDDAVICVELRGTLELFGYKVEIAHSFESALHRYSNAPFDAILVQFNLRSERWLIPGLGRELT